MRRSPVHQGDEGGFTLIELLAVISILGIISFGLTEAVILGFKTTDAITTDVTRIVGVQALRSYITDDIARAEQVNDPDPAAVDGCSASPEAFLHLAWNEGAGVVSEVTYSLEPDVPAIDGQLQLVRWACGAAGSPGKRMLGLLEFTFPGEPPVLALCQYPASPPVLASPTPCSASSSTLDPQPATVTLRILTNRPNQPPQKVDLTVRRGTT